jgi:glycosyltransferase involved in cell wall biosynthesis
LKEPIVYTYPVNISFVRNDLALLKKHFSVVDFFFNPSPKWTTPFFLLYQFFFLLFHAPGKKAFVTQYHSLLPGMMARLLGKPHLIIPGGTDGVYFPEINYGNYRKFMLRKFTHWSYLRSTHLAPVADELMDWDYSYYETLIKKQGIYNLYKGTKAPFTTLFYGYDPQKFFCDSPKKPGSVLTVSQMGPQNFFRKGIDLLLDLARENPDCTFTLVGDQPGMKYPSPPPNFRILPFIPYDELQKIYRESEFYYQVSICEGFPSAVCEAMLCECIPIVSDVGAMPLIVGDTGFILEKRESDKLKEIFREALNTNRPELGKKARKRIMENFPPETRNKLVELIKNLIKAGA